MSEMADRYRKPAEGISVDPNVRTKFTITADSILGHLPMETQGDFSVALTALDRLQAERRITPSEKHIESILISLRFNYRHGVEDDTI